MHTHTKRRVVSVLVHRARRRSSRRRKERTRRRAQGGEQEEREAVGPTRIGLRVRRPSPRPSMRRACACAPCPRPGTGPASRSHRAGTTSGSRAPACQRRPHSRTRQALATSCHGLTAAGQSAAASQSATARGRSCRCRPGCRTRPPFHSPARASRRCSTSSRAPAPRRSWTWESRAAAKAVRGGGAAVGHGLLAEHALPLEVARRVR